ncbi:hypothetical protein GQ457_02G027120 [Hibiscus cannabinus]
MKRENHATPSTTTPSRAPIDNLAQYRATTFTEMDESRTGKNQEGFEDSFIRNGRVKIGIVSTGQTEARLRISETRGESSRQKAKRSGSKDETHGKNKRLKYHKENHSTLTPSQRSNYIPRLQSVFKPSASVNADDSMNFILKKPLLVNYVLSITLISIRPSQTHVTIIQASQRLFKVKALSKFNLEIKEEIKENIQRLLLTRNFELQLELIISRGEMMRSLPRSLQPERYGFLVTTHGDVILVDQDEPKTYQEVVSSPDSEKWLEAMGSEMDSMSENQVWTLVEPPEGIKPIGCKWVFKKKTDMNGNVQTYKGRLVAKGF